MTQDWRTVTNSTDYFNQQQKKTAIEQRRPTVRKASDLVGPGIGAGAVRITDFSDLLATFNGYYSAEAGAANAPNEDESFIGQTISDAALGGRQTFTGFTTGSEYYRTFVRSPSDPELIEWGPWSGQRVLPTLSGNDPLVTEVPSGFYTVLRPPVFDHIAGVGVYEGVPEGLRIRKQGVYTGTFEVSGPSLSHVRLQRPDGDTSISITYSSQRVAEVIFYPFTVWATDDQQAFSVALYHLAGFSVDCWWRFHITRLGDAV